MVSLGFGAAGGMPFEQPLQPVWITGARTCLAHPEAEELLSFIKERVDALGSPGIGSCTADSHARTGRGRGLSTRESTSTSGEYRGRPVTCRRYVEWRSHDVVELRHAGASKSRPSPDTVNSWSGPPKAAGVSWCCEAAGAVAGSASQRPAFRSPAVLTVTQPGASCETMSDACSVDGRCRAGDRRARGREFLSSRGLVRLRFLWPAVLATASLRVVRDHAVRFRQLAGRRCAAAIVESRRRRDSNPHNSSPDHGL